MFFWKFKIVGYDSDIKEFTEEGLTYGTTFAEAVENLEAWYGDEILNIYIEPVTEEDQPYLFEES